MRKATGHHLVAFAITTTLLFAATILLHTQVATTTTQPQNDELLADGIPRHPAVPVVTVTPPSGGPIRSKLKIYVYDLPHIHSLEYYLQEVEWQPEPRSNCDWNMNVCREIWEPQYSSIRQAGGDAILIQKFRTYPNRVRNPQDADLFVVPYPHSSICRLYNRVCWQSCSMYCPKERSNRIGNDVRRMLGSLDYLNETTVERHLFLLTSDTMNHKEELRNMPLYVSLGGANYPGSTNIVIPPPNTEPDYQPSSLEKFDWTKPRNVAVFFMASDSSPLRQEAFAIMEKTPTIGGLPVEGHKIVGRRNFTISAQDAWKKYRDSYFCPVIEGDFPFQKRFFDAAVSGCLPVVLAFPASDCNPHKSWFRKGWPGYNDTLPFPSSVDYSRFVVQLESVEDMVPTLTSLLENKTKITAMQSALSRAAPKLVYGLGEELLASGDAFDEILGELERYISQLDQRRNNNPGGGGGRRKFYKFCPDCIWSATTTCAGRVQFIIDTYGAADRTSIAETLAAQKPQCRTYKGDEDNALAAAESGAAAAGAATYEFCHECVWTPGTSCGERATFLSDEYGKDRNTTMVNVAAKSPQCRRTKECKR